MIYNIYNISLLIYYYEYIIRIRNIYVCYTYIQYECIYDILLSIYYCWYIIIRHTIYIYIYEKTK